MTRIRTSVSWTSRSAKMVEAVPTKKEASIVTVRSASEGTLAVRRSVIRNATMGQHAMLIRVPRTGLVPALSMLKVGMICFFVVFF